MAHKLFLVVLLVFIGLGVSGCYVGFEGWHDGGHHHGGERWADHGGGHYHR